MVILIRKVQNETTEAFSLEIPGTNPNSPVALAPSVTVDLLTLLSVDELETIQGQISGLISRGSLSSQGTSDTSARVQPQIVLADAPAAAVSYTQVDIQAMVALLNDLKAKVNGMNS